MSSSHLRYFYPFFSFLFFKNSSIRLNISSFFFFIFFISLIFSISLKLCNLQPFLLFPACPYTLKEAEHIFCLNLSYHEILQGSFYYFFQNALKLYFLLLQTLSYGQQYPHLILSQYLPPWNSTIR